MVMCFDNIVSLTATVTRHSLAPISCKKKHQNETTCFFTFTDLVVFHRIQSMPSYSSSSSFSKSKSKSKSKPQWRYDVFINFRGEDTRRNFVSHLYSALTDAGVNAFLDDEKLDKGEELKSELLHAIEGSQITIVVFSQNYIHSTWCLDELLKIMECHAFRGQVVMPVFYDIGPSFLRDAQDISFEVISNQLNRIKLWKKALTQAANLAGWDLRNYRNENDVMKEIVGEVLKRLDRTYLSITNFPVGLECRLQHGIDFIRNKKIGTCILGIWGMGGIGKTTIAKSICNEIRHEFKYKSFLANIREVWGGDRGPIDLQEQLLSDILKTTKMNVHSIDWGKGKIKEMLCTKKVLLVLDDVSTFEQLNALCGNRNEIGQGSVIIITTRNVRLLKEIGVDCVHGVQKMTKIESLELFSWHAFRKANPTRDFFELSKEVITYCGGLPLALEVLGSYLYKRRKEEWQSVLSKLKEIPHNKIQEKLKISYDGLSDNMEKDIFLDICCFFIGKDRGYVTEILNGCGLHADIGIRVLVERSLIKVEKNNKLGTHDLLRDMGREIVRQSSPLPQKRSRLWVHNHVLDILTEQTGTAAIEGLALKLQRTNRVRFSAETFENMKRLRLLQFDHVQLAGDYGHLSKHLTWIYWRGFSSKYIPDNFYQGNVVAIDMKHSNLKVVWKEPLQQLLERLKFLNLSHSKFLSKTPDFSRLPNLERLILKDCPNLSEVHHSIGDLRNLLHLNLKDCTCLQNLPVIIYKLKSLRALILSGCSKIDKLEEDIVQMESLTTLIADNTSLKQVPFSIVRFKKIVFISLCGYKGLASDLFPSIIWSWMSPTRGLVSSIQSFGSTSTSLVFMYIKDNNLGNLLSKLSEFSKLRSICVQCNSDLQLTQELRRMVDDFCKVHFAMETTYAPQMSENSVVSRLIGMGSYYQVMDMLSNNMTEVLKTHGSSDFLLPGDNYPYWLAYTAEGYSVTFQVPDDSDCPMKGMILCVVFSSTPENMATESLATVFIFNYTKYTIQIYKQTTTMSFTDEDWVGIISNLGPGDNVEIFVGFGQGVTVKKAGVYLIYSQSVVTQMPSPEVSAQPSGEGSAQSSPEVEMEPSLSVQMEPSLSVQMELSKKPKKKKTSKSAKKMRACLCFS